MVSVLVSILFSSTPYFPLVGGEELKWCQLAHHQLIIKPKTSFYSAVYSYKPMIKAQISGRMVSSGISDVASASVHSDKIRLKKLMMTMKMIITIIIIIIIIIMNKSQETMVLEGARN